jgi:hypothetical protein
MLGFGFFTIFQAALNYLIDTFTRYAASAIAANTFLRSIFAAAFPLFATPSPFSLETVYCLSLTWYPSVSQTRRRLGYELARLLCCGSDPYPFSVSCSREYFQALENMSDPTIASMYMGRAFEREGNSPQKSCKTIDVARYGVLG